jgi:hypothetical protein
MYKYIFILKTEFNIKICLLRFKPLSAKEVIHNVLFDHLSTKAYDKYEAQKWSKEIADTIRDKMKSK